MVLEHKNPGKGSGTNSPMNENLEHTKPEIRLWNTCNYHAWMWTRGSKLQGSSKRVWNICAKSMRVWNPMASMQVSSSYSSATYSNPVTGGLEHTGVITRFVCRHNWIRNTNAPWSRAGMAWLSSSINPADFSPGNGVWWGLWERQVAITRVMVRCKMCKCCWWGVVVASGGECLRSSCITVGLGCHGTFMLEGILHVKSIFLPLVSL